MSPLRPHLTPLSSTDPGADPADLEPLAAELEGAAVVGLGEATHGTREFLRLKHRLIRFLVGRGVRTVAFEADFTAMLAVDEFVRGEGGSAAAALDDLTMWQWRTEAVRALLEWLRSFNEGRPASDRVRICGVDLGTADRPARRLQSMISGVETVEEAPTEALARILDLDVSGGVTDEGRTRDEYLDATTAAARSVRAHLDDHQAAYRTAFSDDEWHVAHRLPRVIEMTCEWHRVRHRHEGPHPDGMAERDRLMAENLAWWHGRDTGTAVILWAHNSHVKRGTFDDGQRWTDERTMGAHLDRQFGDRYRPFGFDVGRGSVRAIPGDEPDADEIRVYDFDEPPAGSATAELANLDEAPCFLDLRGVAGDSRLESWSGEPSRIRWVGSVYDPDAPHAGHTMETDLPRSFDGLFFVERSSPTRPADNN